ncbi:MAG: hypothetical protein E7625_04325 [Ruminococcaceae bacterium]|nr:hypothetical protein [Oscillospiraceae bacterium]
MDKKPSNVNFVIRLTVILAFFAVMLFPMCLMALDGPDEAKAEMQEDTVRIEAPTFENYLSGTFQSTFEAWLSKYYPLRSKIVSTFRQMQIDVENAGVIVQIMNVLKGDIGPEAPVCDMHADDDFDGVCDVCGEKLYDVPDIIPGDGTGEGSGDEGDDEGGDEGGNTPSAPKPPVNVYLDPNNIYFQINRLEMMQVPKEPTGFKGNNRVWIGKSGYLYESTYIDEYMGYSDPYTSVTDEGLQEMVDRFEYIQTELAKRGITMLYVITSSKASAYSDYIPDHYKNSHIAKPGYVRPIERLRKMLAESDVNYLDSAEYYKEIGLLVTFPKTGIHWNALASFESTAKLIQMYQKISGKTTVTPYAKGVLSYASPPSPVNNEQDVFKILYDMVDPKYREEAIKDSAYYFPDIGLKNTGSQKINVLVQGGSFAHSIVYFINQYGVGNVTQIYYNGYDNYGNDTLGDNSPWMYGPEVWENWLRGKDLVIFEATEQQIRGAHKTAGMGWQEASQNGHLGHNAVYDSLYEYLKAHEGEY